MDKISAVIKRGLVVCVIFAAFAIFSACEKYKFTPPEVDPNAPWSLSTDIQPIFNSNCVSCHGGAIAPDLREGRSHEALTEGGYVETPGESSRLYTMLNEPSHEAKTTETEKLMILYWIEQGAENN